MKFIGHIFVEYLKHKVYNKILESLEQQSEPILLFLEKACCWSDACEAQDWADIQSGRQT